HRFGKLALQLDAKQAVLQARARDHDMIGKLEAADEAALRNTAVEEFTLGGAAVFLAEDDKLTFLHLEIELAFRKASPGRLDRVGVIVLDGLLDVVGRIALCAVKPGCGVDQAGEPVEADDGAIKGGKVECAHGLCPRKQQGGASSERPPVS